MNVASSNGNFICPDCNENVSILKEGLCDKCRRRKNILKEKYIPFINLSEKEKEKVIKSRTSSNKYLENKKKKEDKVKKQKQTRKLNKHNIKIKELEEEVNNNLKLAYEKLNINTEPKYVLSLYNPVIVLDLIDTIYSYDKQEFENQKAIVTKKIDTIDKYIIDILHNIEHLDINDDEQQLYESKKIKILREIRRDLKNKEKSIQMCKKFFNSLCIDKTKLNDIKKDLNNYVNAIDSQYYNPYVEEPKTDKKILGLHKYRCSSKICSSKTNRKILFYKKEVTANNTDDAKNKFIELIRADYGEDSVWEKIYTEFIN